MSYYIEQSFNFVKVFVAGYIAYKNPNSIECIRYFDKTLRDSLVSSKLVLPDELPSLISHDKLDESHDEECLEGDPDDIRCVICMENRRKTMILPCRHSHTCIGCVKRIDKCPVCRTPIQMKISYIN